MRIFKRIYFGTVSSDDSEVANKKLDSLKNEDKREELHFFDLCDKIEKPLNNGINSKRYSRYFPLSFPLTYFTGS